MSKWVSVKDKLPPHHRLVLSLSNRNTVAVTIFMNNKKMMDDLRKKGMAIPVEEDEGYSFCSQEIKGNTFNNVTHWQPLPEPPKN